MPYVNQVYRDVIDPMMDGLMAYIGGMSRVEELSAGNLNYIITKIINEWVRSKGLRYATINEVKGVLHCVIDEFNRRIVGPYEDSKIEDNGDVYPPELL